MSDEQNKEGRKSGGVVVGERGPELVRFGRTIHNYLAPTLKSGGPLTGHLPPKPTRLVVNKRTQRIRFENETEDEVTIVIESK